MRLRSKTNLPSSDLVPSTKSAVFDFATFENFHLKCTPRQHIEKFAEFSTPNRHHSRGRSSRTFALSNLKTWPNFHRENRRFSPSILARRRPRLRECSVSLLEKVMRVFAPETAKFSENRRKLTALVQSHWKTLLTLLLWRSLGNDRKGCRASPPRCQLCIYFFGFILE